MTLIVSKLCGGLGNQMFQYALGRRLSLDRDVPLMLRYANATSDTSRVYALGRFKIQAALASAAYMAWLQPWPRVMPRRLAGLPRWPGRARYVRENGFPFDPDVLNAPAPACLEGYWQSEKYFLDAAPRIRSDFQLAEPMTETRQEVARQITDSMAVSVHVRRGDYVANPVISAYHGSFGPDWYEAAMTRMADTVDNPQFFVFSDDPAWARANLPQRWPIAFVEPQSDRRDFEDLHLMAACRHHIIANSSFSWWGAWLNPRDDKRVIAPQRWFNQASNDTRDLIPPGWQRM